MAAKETKPQILLADKVELNTTETLNLLQVINAIVNANPMLPPSGAKFIAKNQTKLLSRHEKNSFDEKGLREKYNEYIMFVEQDAEGRDIFWNGVDDNIVYKENPLSVAGATTDQIVDEEKSIYGVKAYFDKNGGKLIDVKTDQQITDKMILAQMKPYVADVEKRKLYEEKLIEFDKELDEIKDKKYTVHVQRISWDYLEQVRLAIPPTTYNQSIGQKVQIDLHSFDKYLTIQDAEDEEPGETEEVKSPQMSVVKE